jgi:DNA-directed RNA polymerase sigma subunit (sigma70/sigma32)
VITIDKKDNLYKYLTNLGVVDVNAEYLHLAENGRYKLDDVRQYYRASFQPSSTEDIDESELEKVLDYYLDIKNAKKLTSAELKKVLSYYKKNNSAEVLDLIVKSQLNDVFMLCVNYKTLHKEADIQDLVQVANIGLMNAIEKYNVNARLDFKDYLVYWVREKINNEFKEKTNG